MSLDFDWVTIRSKCSALEVLKRLQRGADEDARIRTGLPAAAPRVTFSVKASAEGFSVVRSGNDPASVEFEIAGDGIRAKRDGLTLIEATLVVNDQGECKLKVGSQELSAWQFRRRALEDLFFNF